MIYPKVLLINGGMEDNPRLGAIIKENNYFNIRDFLSDKFQVDKGTIDIASTLSINKPNTKFITLVIIMDTHIIHSINIQNNNELFFDISLHKTNND